MEKTFKPGDKVQFLDNDGKLCVDGIYHNSYIGDIHDVKHGSLVFENGINIGTVIRTEKELVVVEYIDKNNEKVRLDFYPQYLTLKNPYLKTVTVIDWESVPLGTFFTWNDVVGKINIVGNYFYLCSDKMSGVNEELKWGYKYSWKVHRLDIDNWSKFKNITLSDVCPEGHTIPEEVETDFHTEMAGYTPVIRKGSVKFGCQTIPNSVIRELVANLRD